MLSQAMSCSSRCSRPLRRESTVAIDEAVTAVRREVRAGVPGKGADAKMRPCLSAAVGRSFQVGCAVIGHLHHLGMAELTLTYGTMAAGKSTAALQLHFQLRQMRDDVELWTLGDRSGEGRVTSRLGIDAPAVAVVPGANIVGLRRDLIRRGIRILIVDEVQFASEAQVDELARLVDDHGVTVNTFGLGADFLLRPFPGTARLFAIADVVQELPLAAYCWCGERGRCNARVVGGVVQRGGDQHMLGDVNTGAVSYRVLCRRHYRAGELG